MRESRCLRVDRVPTDEAVLLTEGRGGAGWDGVSAPSAGRSANLCVEESRTKGKSNPRVKLESRRMVICVAAAQR